MAWDDGYLNVPDDFVMMLGRMVVIAGAVESVARSIAYSLGVPEADFRDAQLKAVLKTVRSRAATGLPPWATVDEPTIRVWADQVAPAIVCRDEYTHSRYFAQASSKLEWVARRTHMRSGRTEDVTADNSASVIGDLEQLHSRGESINARLQHFLRSPSDGVYFYGYHRPMPGLADYRIAVLSDRPDVTLSRPTADDELEAARRRANYPDWPDG